MKILKVKCLAPTRLDNYLMQQYPALTPGRLNKALRENKIKLNGKMIVEWLAIRRVIYLRSFLPKLCKLYEYKSLRREWFFFADFYVMLIKLCLLYYVN